MLEANKTPLMRRGLYVSTIMYWPNRYLIRYTFVRGLAFWIGVRALMSGMLLTLNGSDPLRLPTGTLFVILVICSCLTLVSLQRRNERLLWANLGVSTGLLAVLVAVPPLAAEALLRWLK